MGVCGCGCGGDSDDSSPVYTPVPHIGLLICSTPVRVIGSEESHKDVSAAATEGDAAAEGDAVDEEDGDENCEAFTGDAGPPPKLTARRRGDCAAAPPRARDMKRHGLSYLRRMRG